MKLTKQMPMLLLVISCAILGTQCGKSPVESESLQMVENAELQAADALATTPACFDNYLFDTFKKLEAQPIDPNSHWWVSCKYGDTEFKMDEDFVASDGSCAITREKERGVDFVRFSLFPDDTPGFYTDAFLGDGRNGYIYDVPGPWRPSVGHPIVFSARFRFIGNFNQDGSGGAVGTAGIFLWNMPLDWPNRNKLPGKALGFAWVTENSGGGFLDGFAVEVVDEEKFFYDLHRPQQTMNLADWNTFRCLWEEFSDGRQQATFWINSELVVRTDNFEPMGDFWIEFWHDNQRLTFPVENTEFQNPTEPQHFDVDWIKVIKL